MSRTARRRFAGYLFLGDCVRKRCVDIELKHFPVFVHGNGDIHPDALHTTYQSVRLTAIDCRPRSPSLNYHSSAKKVFGFDLEHRFTRDDLLVRGNRTRRHPVEHFVLFDP